jgi:hypothetical protein
MMRSNLQSDCVGKLDAQKHLYADHIRALGDTGFD